MTGDRYGGVGEFAIAKHFDVLTNPRVLKPKRGMTTHTASTGIGNIIVASDGLMYGSGIDLANTPAGKLWVLGGYGSLDDFAALSTNQLSGFSIVYDLLVDWVDAGNSRKIIWASANKLVASQYSGGAGSADTSSLTFSSIGQGLVHPKDKYLYFPYRTSTTPYIGLIAPNATSFAGLNATAFTLPLGYRAHCLSHYGNFLAIPLTGVTAVSLVNSNIVALWDRDTSISTFAETITWGNGSLKVLNNVQGTLIGVSEHGSDSLQAGTTQDYNSIQIKIWAGGAEPTLIKEIKAEALPGGSGQPSVSINPRVNFIYNNRLYFSVNVNPNDGIRPARYGLWSVGKNKTTGEWTVNLEHMATNTNTETGVIAAAMVGDYVECVHTSAGTLTKSTNGNPSSSTYGATSVYESVINPEMDLNDSVREKELYVIGVNFEPLTSGASVVLKYRVDSNGDDDDWVTVATFDTDGETRGEKTDAAGATFLQGTRYEFRLESVGGAVITGFSYKYNTLKSNL